jgi:hypothetical protein
LSKRQSRASKRFKAILNSDPSAAIVDTPAGAWKIPRTLFPQLFKLSAPCFIRLSDRVAKVADGYAVNISEQGFYARKVDDGKWQRFFRIKTNSQTMIERSVYNMRGIPSLHTPEKRERAILEREREGALQYGLVLLFARA